MYNDLFTIGPFTVHSYGLMIAIAILTAFLYGEKRAKKKGLDGDIFFNLALFCVGGALLGTKILFCIVEWKTFINNPMTFFSSEGFVVYGGIILGVLTGLWYTHHKKVSFFRYLDVAMPLLAIGMGFGRIGCFLAGCCYGKETDSFIGVTFHNSGFAPNNVKLIPVQLISSIGCFLIALFIIQYDNRNKKQLPGRTGALFFMIYGVGRFLIEFLRNDHRGTVGIFSTSQFISLFIVAIGITMFTFITKRSSTSDENK